MAEQEPCSYCAEIRGINEDSYFLSEVAASLKKPSRYLFTSKTFLVFPSVGALVPGHLLIAPKRHITAMAHLSKDELYELNGVISELRYLLSKIYNKNLVLMEHGTRFDRCSSGACVSHAHIHILPSEISLSNLIHGNKMSIKIDQLDHILTLNKDYLLYSDDCKTYYYNEAENVPSQYFRAEIFKASKLSGHWNWVIDHRIEIMNQTIEDIIRFVTNIDKSQSPIKWLKETPLCLSSN